MVAGESQFVSQFQQPASQNSLVLLESEPGLANVLTPVRVPVLRLIVEFSGVF